MIDLSYITQHVIENKKNIRINKKIISIDIENKNGLINENYINEFLCRVKYLLNIYPYDKELKLFIRGKDYICEQVKNKFSFIRFRNEKKFKEIKNLLNTIEDLVCKLLEDEDYSDRVKKIEKTMSKFYKVVDKYLYFTK